MRICRALKASLLLAAACMVFLATAAFKVDEEFKAFVQQAFTGKHPGSVVKKIKIEKKVITGTISEGQEHVIPCTAIVTVKDASGTKTKKNFTFHLTFKGGKGARDEPYKFKCEDPLLFQLPADASDFSGTFSGDSGSGALLVNGGLGSVPIGNGGSLIAEAGTQLVLAGLPEDVADDTYDLSVDFTLSSARPISAKPVLTAEASCGGQTIFPPMVPAVGSMGEAPSISVPVADMPVTLELPLADMPEEASAEIECPCSDDVTPTCRMTGSGTDSSGRKYIEVSVADAKSGLDSIDTLIEENVDVNIPEFDPGTNDTLLVRATKIYSSQVSRVEFKVTDRCDNVTYCDPVVSLEVRTEGKPVSTTFSNIPRAEHWLRIYNGDPGIRSLAVAVNGEKIKIPSLRDGEELILDIAPAMLPAANIVTVEARGKPGGSALVVVSD